MKKKKKLLIILLLLIVSIGFAYVSGSLGMNFTTFFRGGKWDVHFANFNLCSDSVMSSRDAVIDGTNVTFYASDMQPGDAYHFTVDIVNNGTIDAMINSMSISGLDDLSDYVEYTIKYSDGIPMLEKQELNYNTTKILDVYIKYKEDNVFESDVPSSFTMSLDYIEKNDEAITTEIDTTSATLNVSSFKNYVTSNDIERVEFKGAIDHLGVENVGADEGYTSIADNTSYDDIFAWHNGDTMYVAGYSYEYPYQPMEATAGDWLNSLTDGLNLDYMDVKYIDSSYTTSFEFAFSDIKELVNASCIDVDNAEYFYGTFNDTYIKNDDLSSWRFKTDMVFTNAFWDARADYIDMTKWGYGIVQVADGMFAGYNGGFNFDGISDPFIRATVTISCFSDFNDEYTGDIDVSLVFQFDRLSNCSCMFTGFYKNANKLSVNLDFIFNSTYYESTDRMFSSLGSNCNELDIRIVHFESEYMTDFSQTFAYVGENSPKVIASGFDNIRTSNGQYFNGMFLYFAKYSTTNFNLNLNWWDVSNCIEHDNFAYDAGGNVYEPNWLN